MRLDPRASAVGVRLISHDVLPSTNTEALTLARNGERGPLWIVAGRQSAGRGRRGRAWVSEAGNLYATLLLTDAAPPEKWPQLALVAALSVHDAVVELESRLKPRLSIKWPNDLLADHAKFAGVLTEGEAGEPGAVAIGIGINCKSHPSDTDFPAIDLAHAGAEIPPEVLFAELSAKMLGRLAQWNRGEHFATIRTDWLARAAGLGGLVRLRLPDREVVGRFETIDEGGRLLLLMSDDTRQSFAAGDILQLVPADQFSEP